MTQRERVLAVLSGKMPDVIPGLTEGAMDATCLKDFRSKYTGNSLKDTIYSSDFFGNADANVGVGLAAATLDRSDDHHTY